MSDQITTPEALDALPEGSVIARWYGDGSGPSVYVRCDRFGRRGWEASGDEEGPYGSATIAKGGPLTLLYRPDRPSDLAALRAGIEGLDLDFLENAAYEIGHTIYEATELEPAECTDECNACFIEDTVARLRTLLDGAR